MPSEATDFDIHELEEAASLKKEISFIKLENSDSLIIEAFHSNLTPTLSGTKNLLLKVSNNSTLLLENLPSKTLILLKKQNYDHSSVTQIGNIDLGFPTNENVVGGFGAGVFNMSLVEKKACALVLVEGDDDDFDRIKKLVLVQFGVAVLKF